MFLIRPIGRIDSADKRSRPPPAANAAGSAPGTTMPQLDPAAYPFLGASLLVALLLDHACVRLLLEWLRPTTRYVFWIARAGKLTAIVAWVLFFNHFWYPRFVSAGQPVSSLVTNLETVGLLALVGLAFLTLPRAPYGKGGPHA